VTGHALTGNQMELNEQQVAVLNSADRQRTFGRMKEKLSMVGTHYVADGIWDTPPLIDDNNRRLAAGEEL